MGMEILNSICIVLALVASLEYLVGLYLLISYFPHCSVYPFEGFSLRIWWGVHSGMSYIHRFCVEMQCNSLDWNKPLQGKNDGHKCVLGVQEINLGFVIVYEVSLRGWTNQREMGHHSANKYARTTF